MSAGWCAAKSSLEVLATEVERDVVQVMRLYEVIVKALLRSDSGENDLLEVGVAQTFGEIAYSCRAAGTFT